MDHLEALGLRFGPAPAAASRLVGFVVAQPVEMSLFGELREAAMNNDFVSIRGLTLPRRMSALPRKPTSDRIAAKCREVPQAAERNAAKFVFIRSPRRRAIASNWGQ